MHEIAERRLAAAAAAAPGAPWRPAVPRGCLLRRVATDASRPGLLEAALEAAGLRGDRLSVWAWPAGGRAGAFASDHAVLGAVANLAALESVLVGELPASALAGGGPNAAANLLAGFGFLGTAVGLEEAAAALVGDESGSGGSSSQQRANAARGAGRPMLFLARQKLLSMAEMDLLASHGQAQAEAEESDIGTLPFS